MAKRLEIPEGHGEVLAEPPFSEWERTARDNASASERWDFEVGGLPVAGLRELARRESRHEAEDYSRRLGVPLPSRDERSPLIVMTGHQPVFFGPGVWAKHFALQRLADETQALAFDLVVDTDAADDITVEAPCLEPPARKCAGVLVRGDGRTFGDIPVPGVHELETFRDDVTAVLDLLPSADIGRNFASFYESLLQAAGVARNVGELVTSARRHYEIPAGTDYLELPVSGQAAGEAFTRLAVEILLDAGRFRGIHNEELASYREAEKVRSAAHPFPDLREDGSFVETPFWLNTAAGRSAVWAREADGEVELSAEGRVVATLPQGPSRAVASLREAGLRLVPRALTLTLHNRLFVADLFVHGVGGGKYDRVTDQVARRLFGIEPPVSAVLSMTLHLPLEGPIDAAGELAAARSELQELAHNPDRFVDRLDEPTAREEARGLVLEKSELVAEIAADGADKKALGARIRAANEALAGLLEPATIEARAKLDELERASRAYEVLRDRSYPFCLWDPVEVRDEL
jgi:hypothetical protein